LAGLIRVIGNMVVAYFFGLPCVQCTVS